MAKEESHGLQFHSQSRHQEGGRTRKMPQAGQMAVIKAHAIGAGEGSRSVQD